MTSFNFEGSSYQIQDELLTATVLGLLKVEKFTPSFVAFKAGKQLCISDTGFKQALVRKGFAKMVGEAKKQGKSGELDLSDLML